jgi:hypothetical protein
MWNDTYTNYFSYFFLQALWKILFKMKKIGEENKNNKFE